MSIRCTADQRGTSPEDSRRAGVELVLGLLPLIPTRTENQSAGSGTYVSF